MLPLDSTVWCVHQEMDPEIYNIIEAEKDRWLSRRMVRSGIGLADFGRVRSFGYSKQPTKKIDRETMKEVLHFGCLCFTLQPWWIFTPKRIKCSISTISVKKNSKQTVEISWVQKITSISVVFVCWMLMSTKATPLCEPHRFRELCTGAGARGGGLSDGQQIFRGISRTGAAFYGFLGF